MSAVQPNTIVEDDAGTLVHRAPIAHPSAWKVSDFTTPADYTIELDATHLGELDPDTATPDRDSDRVRYRIGWGLLVHECAHAHHSRWNLDGCRSGFGWRLNVWAGGKIFGSALGGMRRQFDRERHRISRTRLWKTEGGRSYSH